MGPNWSSYYNNGSYSSDFATYYNPITGISHEPNLSQDSLEFGSTSVSPEDKKVLDAEVECSSTSVKYFSASCFQKRQDYIWSLLSYPVLTKGQAISELLPSIDFALWDSELAKKKTVKIEEETSPN